MVVGLLSAAWYPWFPVFLRKGESRNQPLRREDEGVEKQNDSPRFLAHLQIDKSVYEEDERSERREREI